MKVEELILILSSIDHESDVLVSTVGYYERNHYTAGYERERPQKVKGVLIENSVIVINGGEERTV